MSTFVRCWRLGIFFVLLLGAAIAASADEPLIIVGDQHYVPLEYRYQGEPQGLNVELVRAIFAAMNRPITLRLMPWNQAQTQVLSGGIHVRRDTMCRKGVRSLKPRPSVMGILSI